MAPFGEVMPKLIDAARAAQILQSRWEQDPLRLWEPNERQQMFLECEKPEAALLGANRSGKSDAGAALAASFLRFGNPNPRTSYAMNGRIEIRDRAVSVWVIGLTEKLIKEGIQPKIVTTNHTPAETHPAFIPNSEVDSWNINDQTWRLKNGSMVAFKSADAGRDVFQSAGRELVLFDEICDEEVYKEAVLRVPGGQRRLLIRLCATLLPPLGMQGGVSWYFPVKIKKWWSTGNKENVPNGGNPDKFLDIFSMGLRHNKYIHPDEIERLEQLFPPGSLEWRIRINGELLPSLGGTLAYPAFNRAVHVSRDVVPQNMDERTPLCLFIDFNVSPCVWEVGQYIDDTWFIFDEIKFDVCNVGMMVEEFRRRYPRHGAPIRIYGDQTGIARNVQTSVSNYELIQEAFKGYPVPIQLLLPTRNPAVVDRLNAVNRKLSGPNGRVGIIVGPLCEELIADFEEVLRDPRGGIKKVHHPENSYYQRTHASDALGYGVSFTDPVPRFISVVNNLRRVPRPGYLRHNPQPAGGYPREYEAESRLRFGRSGAILPPQRPDLRPGYSRPR
jgi:hypothetical protein